MKYHELEDNFLEIYNPQTLTDYLKLRWRKAGKKNFQDVSNRIIFQIVRYGTMEIKIGTNIYQLNQGYGLVMDLNEPHTIKVNNWNSFDASTIVYPYTVVNNFYNNIKPGKIPGKSRNSGNDSNNESFTDIIKIQPRILKTTPEIDLLVYHIRNPLKKEIFGGETESLLSSKLLLVYILRMNLVGSVENYLLNEPSGNLKQNIRQRIKTVLEYIQSNYSRELTIDRLSEIANMNKFYFCKTFKRAMGKTPKEYIDLIRTIRAKEHLINTSMSITEIADDIGFSSVSAFTQFFKRNTGISPTDFKSKSRIDLDYNFEEVDFEVEKNV